MTAGPLPDTPALSRPVLLDTVSEQGLSVAFDATPAEREALRALNGLVALSTLRASLLVRRAGRDGVTVTGEVSGQVVQTCVVSLEPFDAAVREAVSVTFLQPAALERWRAEHAADPAEPEAGDLDEPDVILAGRIDLGVLAAEHLTLGLDPYPKKPGVRFEEVAPAASAAESSPFAALKALRPDES